MILSRNPKKAALRRLAACLAFVLVAAAVLIPAAPAQAASAAISGPAKIRIGVGPNYLKEIYFTFPSSQYTMKNFSATMDGKAVKALKTRVTYGFPGENGYSRGLSVYAAKSGTYKLKFDVYKSGKKNTSRTLTVYAVNAEAGGVMKSVSFDGKTCPKPGGQAIYLPNKTSGVIKFNPAAGLTVTGIKMSCLNEKGAWVTKSIKNGSKVTLNTIGSKYIMDNDAAKSVLRDMWAETRFEVTLKDSYAGGTVPYTIYINRLAAKWVKVKL